MIRLATFVLAVACSSAVRPPFAGLPCSGPVSCGRQQLLDADLALQHAIQERGPSQAFAEVLLPDARYLSEGQGAIAGRQQVGRLLLSEAPFAWTLARGDVSAAGTLGYTFGWVSAAGARGHYAAVWRRREGGWKLAVFLRKPAQAQGAPPPAWFAPFRGEREAPPLAAQTVSGADLTFAALAQATGSMQQAFTAYAAQDAVQLAGTMAFGRDAIHDLMAHAPLLRWAPVVEEVEGDLGYTVGAWERGPRRGHYLTVWRLQSDGAWRFVLDGGVSG